MVEAAAAAVDEEFVRKAEEDHRRLSDRGVIGTSPELAAALAPATALEVDDAETVTMTDYQDATILGIGIIEIAATAKERDYLRLFFFLLMDVIYRLFCSTDIFRFLHRFNRRGNTEVTNEFHIFFSSFKRFLIESFLVCVLFLYEKAF